MVMLCPLDGDAVQAGEHPVGVFLDLDSTSWEAAAETVLHAVFETAGEG